MKRSPTRSLPPPEPRTGRRRARRVLLPPLLLALLAPALGCVTRGTYQEVVSERDTLRRERSILERRVKDLEASNESLSGERVELLNQVEDLRVRREGLEKDVTRLSRTREELQGALAAREKELSELRSTYDGLVSDLQSEVEAGQVRIRQLQNGVTFDLPGEVVFPPGSVQPTAGGLAMVKRIATRVRPLDDRVEVHGYTDDVPISGPLARRFPTNWELAGARAARVARALVEQGVDPTRVSVVSHGQYDPVATNDTPEGRAQNRRIEIRLIPVQPAGSGAPEPASAGASSAAGEGSGAEGRPGP